LTLLPGHRYCVIGPNGAGKSTLANIICGAIRPTSGQVLLDGQDVSGRPPYAIAARGVARKFQVPSVFPSLTVRDNLRLASNCPSARRARNADRKITGADELVSTTGLADLTDIPAGHLAHGQTQWLEIAMALLAAPDILLLDEPSAGMGPEETIVTARAIDELLHNVTLFVIEHDMRFVSELDGEVVVMHQGSVFAQGTFTEIRASEIVQDIYLGTTVGL
jgi:ABC-type uncharacterized transport system ATPase subunit